MRRVIGGVERDVERVTIVTSVEPWAQYVLSDHGLLRVRVIVSDVLRVLGLTTPTGGPVYHVESTVVVAAQGNEES